MDMLRRLSHISSMVETSKKRSRDSLVSPMPSPKISIKVSKQTDELNKIIHSTKPPKVPTPRRSVVVPHKTYSGHYKRKKRKPSIGDRCKVALFINKYFHDNDYMWDRINEILKRNGLYYSDESDEDKQFCFYSDMTGRQFGYYDTEVWDVKTFYEIEELVNDMMEKRKIAISSPVIKEIEQNQQHAERIAQQIEEQNTEYSSDSSCFLFDVSDFSDED
jgi:hypothetical protein